MNLNELLQHATKTAYPEPDTEVHCAIIPQVVDMFKATLSPPASVLDIGCGSCFGAKALRAVGYDVTPISVLESEVIEAEQLGFAAMQCEMHQTERLGKFDVAWLRHAAEHSPCPLLLLSNLRAQCQWLYLEVPAPLTTAHHERNPNHYSVLAEGGWLNLLHQAGWEVVVQKSIGLTLPIGPDTYLLFICK